MKQIIPILLLICVLSINANASGLGIYGSSTVFQDTVRVNFIVQDTLGKTLVTPDSFSIVRYYRGVTVDSIDQSSGQVNSPGSTGYYHVKYKASKHYDSVGQYTVFLSVWYKGWNAGATFSYQVAKGGLDAIWDLAAFLGACDGCIRILHPIGSMPKDSGFVIDTSTSPPDTLLYIYFGHSVQDRVMDTTLTDLPINGAR